MLAVFYILRGVAVLFSILIAPFPLPFTAIEFQYLYILNSSCSFFDFGTSYPNGYKILIVLLLCISLMTIDDCPSFHMLASHLHIVGQISTQVLYVIIQLFDFFI